MSLTLLLDLDDTLLENNIDEFLPRYLGAFSKQVASIVEPQKFVSALLLGTQAMTESRRPDITLRDVFNEVFFPLLGLEIVNFQELADRFYAEVFPTLRGLTHPRPEAVELVEQAVKRGYRLVVATNPLFPRTAILQRLAWAGLPVEQYPFDLISSYETFHFTKPDTAYFAEVLGRLGWPNEPAVMVGDDLQRDIAAVRRLGVPAFWMTRDGIQPLDGLEAPTASGRLADVLPWLDKVSPEALQADYTSPSAMLAILRATPAVLDSLCRDLPANAWTEKPEANEWCLTEILCHLRDVDQEVNLPRLQKVLREMNPFLAGKDTDPWAAERRYIRQDGAQALRQFTAARLELVEFLEATQPVDWQRTARHAIFGPTQMVELVGIIAGHDRLHIQQVHKVLGGVSPNR